MSEIPVEKRTPEEMWRAQAETFKERCDEFGKVAHDLIVRGEAELSPDRTTDPRFDVFTEYTVQRLRGVLGWPDRDYRCGAAFCDDPACASHNHDHPLHDD